MGRDLLELPDFSKVNIIIIRLDSLQKLLKLILSLHFHLLFLYRQFSHKIVIIKLSQHNSRVVSHL